jgi:Asp/Glu/hydantoin racemase
MICPIPGRRHDHATLGIIMLDTAFERFAGDIGNPKSFPFPVLYRTVPGATAAAITTLNDDTFLAPFIAAAEALISDGADGIMTSCGFLALYQRKLAECLRVPVAASALLQLPLIECLLGGQRRVGVLTFDAQTLGPKHLAAAGAAPDTPVAGLAKYSAFRRAILGDARADSFSVRESDAVDAALRLTGEHPNLGAIVLECTNFAPHAAAIHAATGLPIYDAMTLAHWFYAGLRPRDWQQTGTKPQH